MVKFSTPRILHSFFAVSLVFLISACASYNPQTANDVTNVDLKGEATYTFYIAGGLGNRPMAESEETQTLLKSYLDKADKNSTLLLTGDYISSDYNDRKANIDRVTSQLSMAENFKGKTRFVPGDEEWGSFDSKEIEWVEDFIKDRDIKRTKVEPNNVCPIDTDIINDDLNIIYVDSNWYIANWDRVDDINRKCTDIVTRRRFVEELEGEIKDARGKNLVIVMHHPVYTNGMFAMNYMGGVSPKKIFFERYKDLRIQVSSLVQELDRVTIVSGHERSLQYLKGGNTHQIISGSMGGAEITKRKKDNITATGGILKFEGKYTHGKEGFAMLKYYKNGSSQVTFVTSEGEKTFDVTEALPKKPEPFATPTNAGETKTVPVVTDEKKLNKSGFYNFIWGSRYRSFYGVPVTADVAILSDVYRGLSVTKAGGGHQSYSARLADADGREYAMRGLEKNALKFLRYKIKGIAYTEEEYEGTFAETAVYDFFTTTHPYMQLVINPLAKAAGINHGNTSLYYLPKQPGFEILGDAYGDQLYFIEERPNDEQKDFEGYNRMNPGGGEIAQFESSTDVFEKLKEDEKYSVDQKAFIRARIFDMLIGDWDRHEDQWRYAQYEITEDDIRFLPVPRDRDAAFSKFDGIAIPLIQLFLPDVRFWQSYDPEIKDVKWFNGEGNNVDRALLNKFDSSEWLEQAKLIQSMISEDVINEAFLRLPKEVQDETSEDIKNKLRGRLANLDKIALRYGEYLNKTVAIHGTNKDDKIEVTRMPQGKTKVVLKRKLKDEVDEVFFERTFDKKETKEIWIYGLDDDDQFIVNGDGGNKIMVRLIGGYGKDDFDVSTKGSLKVYDWKHEKTEFEGKTPAHQFTNQYETNTFHWRQFKENNNILLPSGGFRTDDGLYLGLTDTYTNYGFNGNPFRFQHNITANYFFDYQAVELDYLGIFANIFPKINLEVGGYFTNDSFSNNFFGFGNDTTYDTDTDTDFNRARTQQIKANIGLAGKFLTVRGLFESFDVQDDPTRFFTEGNPELNNEVFETQNYAGAEAEFEYANQDASDFPTKARYLGVTTGFKSNIDDGGNNFTYVSAKVGLQEKLIPSGNLVLATTAEVKANFGNYGSDFYFYHAPTIGGNNGLRGYRNERFAGNTYFYQSTDLKVRLARIVTAAAPITIGTYGGFDYGRVWEKNDNSNNWYNSYGGGVWISTLNTLAFNVGYFVSEEDTQVQVGFGFGF